MPPVTDPDAFADSDGIVDVSRWVVIRDEPGGRDPHKLWLASDPDSPRHEHWLWKSRQRTGDGSESALTDCAEVFVSRLAGRIDIPAAVCRFAVRDGQWGLISLNVTPEGYSLNTGRAYLPEVEGYEHRSTDHPTGERVGRMRRDRGYTLDAVQRVLEGVAPPPGSGATTAFEVFAGYLVLDALVSNTDRHPGNWALLERDQNGTRFLAASYDHGSALGAGLTELNRSTCKPEVFAGRGKANAFDPPKRSLVDLAHEAVARVDAGRWLDKVAIFDREAVRSALVAPPGRLSDVAARFIEGVVLENRRRLCDDHVAED